MKSTIIKVVLKATLSLLACFLLLEASTRVFWSAKLKCSPLSAPKTYVQKMIYPVLHRSGKDMSRVDGYYDVLLLGSSTLQVHNDVIARSLTEKLNYALGYKVRVVSFAMAGQTSLDDYYKYKATEGRFDVVIFYDSINDLRANNCPSQVFREDYSHYSIYRVLSFLDKHPNFPLYSPILLQLVIQRPLEKLGWFGLVPTDKPREDWVAYGGDFKSQYSYMRNVASIIKLARDRDEELILMTFATSPKDDYACLWQYGYPVTMWGHPKNVSKGVFLHNIMLRTLAKFTDTGLIDQAILMPTGGKYFNDICHFTITGCDRFKNNIVDYIVTNAR